MGIIINDGIQYGVDEVLELGESQTTAYRGDRGKIAYDHSQSLHAPVLAERNIITGIQTNGVDASVDSTTRKVDINIPTKVSELNNDKGYITQSDVDISQNHTHINKAILDIINNALIESYDNAVEHIDDTTKHISSEERAKLLNIESGAKVNVQSDWNTTNVSLDSYIKNKPTSMPASDVYSWAKNPTKPVYTPNEVGVVDSNVVSGQVPVFDGTTGKVKSSGYTINSSVPSGAKFTDTVYTHPASHSVDMITTTTDKQFISQTEKNSYADKYTKNEVDNKFSVLETSIDWKEAVDSYSKIATTYPNPQDGWTVNVKDTDYTYRYTGTQWVAISANAIPKATQSVDGLLTKEDKTKVDGIELNANNYAHPSHTAYTTGLYKLVIDNLGHIESATVVSKSDITNLGIPSSDTNTHYASKNAVGGSATATSNTTSALANGNVYLVSVENGVVTSAHNIKGTGGCTVTTDTSGNVLINGVNTYTLPDATASVKGGVKIGDNITISGGTISITYDDIIAALGYTPGSSTSSYTHPTPTRTNTISTASPAHGGTFTVVDSMTSNTEGHITGVNTKTVTLPSVPTSVSGNAGTATKLQTARTINGVAFDGSTNIIIDDANRFQKNGNTGSSSTYWYYPIALLPIDDIGNYGSTIISGRLGGWVEKNFGYIDLILLNRSNFSGTTITASGEIKGNTSVCLGISDIVVYMQTDKSAIVYLKCNSYYAFDLSVKYYQSTSNYTGSYTTTPSGTLIWACSKSDSIVKIDALGNISGNATSATKATNDANGNIIINEMTSATEPTTQKVGDYWVQEYE